MACASMVGCKFEAGKLGTCLFLRKILISRKYQGNFKKEGRKEEKKERDRKGKKAHTVSGAWGLL